MNSTTPPTGQNSLYALALRKDTKNPSRPESDEVTVTKEGEAGADKAKDADKDKKEEKERRKRRTRRRKKRRTRKKPKRKRNTSRDRLRRPSPIGVTRVPVDADNFFRLVATKGYLIYSRDGAPYYGREAYPDTSLVLFSLKDSARKPPWPKKSKGSMFRRMGANSSSATNPASSFSTPSPKGRAAHQDHFHRSNLMVDRVPHEEWVEMYNEVGRRYRDFFYVENMNGYDWNALLAQYRPLVDFVAHRSDLNYVLGELVAELSVSHAYIAGGDIDMPKAARRLRFPACASNSMPLPDATASPKKSSTAKIRKRITGRRSPKSAWTPRKATTSLPSTARTWTPEGQSLSVPPQQSQPSRTVDRQFQAHSRRLAQNHLPAHHREPKPT